MAWRTNLLDGRRAVELAGSAKRVAVVGIKPKSHAGQPAFYVPQYLQQTGVKVIPVPVYYPDVKEILGEPVHRNVASVKGDQIDIVDVFRRPADVPQHVEDIIAALPRAVWLQSGITHAESEERFARAGILVVSDRCLKVDRAAALAQSNL